MMKAPNTISRMKLFAGMSVREIAQAIGTPNRHDSAATPAPSCSVVQQRLQVARAAVGLDVVVRA